MKYIIIYIEKMQARTPQKKKSLQIEHKIQLTNNSCVLNNSTIIQSSNGLGNDGNEPIMNNFSIVSSSSGHQKDQKEQKGTSQIRNNSIANPNSKVSLVRKYVQQELQSRNKYAKEKEKEKQYREVVISDEFIRSHKLYKMLKQQMTIADARHVRQANSLKNQLEIQNNQIKVIKQSSHQLKVELWQYKNQLMELKTMLNQQEQENKKLVEEYEEACKQGQPEGEEEKYEQEREDEEQCKQQSNQPLDQARIQSSLTLQSNRQSEIYQPEQENMSKISEAKILLQNFMNKKIQKVEEIIANQLENEEISNKIEKNPETKIEQM